MPQHLPDNAIVSLTMPPFMPSDPSSRCVSSLQIVSFTYLLMVYMSVIVHPNQRNQSFWVLFPPHQTILWKNTKIALFPGKILPVTVKLHLWPGEIIYIAYRWVSVTVHTHGYSLTFVCVCSIQAPISTQSPNLLSGPHLQLVQISTMSLPAGECFVQQNTKPVRICYRSSCPLCEWGRENGCTSTSVELLCHPQQ